MQKKSYVFAMRDRITMKKLMNLLFIFLVSSSLSAMEVRSKDKEELMGKVAITGAFFSPKDDLRSKLLALIEAERTRIRIAVYTFSDKAIARALLAAAARSVSVECIVDKAYETDPHSKIRVLADSIIPIWVYQPAFDERKVELMHNKFVLFDDILEHRKVVWTGSYNFSKAASERNQENVVVLDDPAIIKQYSEQFVRLKGESKLLPTSGRRKEGAFVFDADPLVNRDDKPRRFERDRGGMGENPSFRVPMDRKTEKAIERAMFVQNLPMLQAEDDRRKRELAWQLEQEKVRVAREAFGELSNKIIGCAKSGDARILAEVLAFMVVKWNPNETVTSDFSACSNHWNTILMRDESNRTAFHWAAELGHLEIIECLFEHLNAIFLEERQLRVTKLIRDRVGRTPHSLAAENNHLEALKLLCSPMGCKILNEENEGGRKQRIGQIPGFELGPVAHAPMKKKVIDFGDQRGLTPLHWAASKGHDEIAKFLISIGVSVNAVDKAGCTALAYAKALGYQTIVSLLLAHGADSAGQDVAAPKLFEQAVREGDIDRVQLLLANGVDVNCIIDHRYNLTGLHCAAYGGLKDMVSFLVAHRAAIGAVTVDGKTALHSAVLGGHKPVVEVLLDNKADINVGDDRGETPLHMAVWSGNSDLVAFLIARGADTSRVNKESKTALQVAETRQPATISYMGVRNEQREHECLVRNQINKREAERIVELLKVVNTNGKVLIEAARVGDKNKVEQMLGSPVDINAKDVECLTALHWAVKNGHKDIVIILMARGAYAEARTLAGSTVLHLAAIFGRQDIVKLILAKGVDIMAANNDGDVPIHYAAASGQKETVLLLKSNGADIRAVNLKGVTVLHRGAVSGKVDVVKLLLSEGADVHAADLDGRTSLHYAAEKGAYDIVEILVAHGARIGVVSKDGKTANKLAKQNGYIEISDFLRLQDPNEYDSLLREACEVEDRKRADFLLARGANKKFIDTPFGKDKKTWLHNAAQCGRKDDVLFLLAHGATIEAEAYWKETPLHLAVRSNAKEMVALLLSRGANAQAVNEWRETPLHIAAGEGYKDIIEMLLVYEIDINAAPSKYRGTALRCAATNGHKDVVAVLLAKGADIKVATHDSKTAMHHACQNGHQEVVEVLLSCRADINAQDDTGCTPLHLAVYKGNKDDWTDSNKALIVFLLERGADRSVVNKYGKKAVELAEGAGKDFMVSLDPQEYRKAIIEAAKKGDVKQIEKLPSCVVNFNVEHSDAYTALHEAAAKGDKDMVIALLSRGHSIATTASYDHKTVLQVAVLKGHIEIVELLLRHRADLNAKDKVGCTALHYAAFLGHKGIVEMLLQHGADPKLKDRDLQTALHRASMMPHEDAKEVAQLLIKYGAEVNAIDRHGATPLFRAKMWNEAVRDLLLLNKAQ